MKTCIVLTQKQQKLYEKLGVDIETFLTWIHREVIKILENNLDPYGTINNLDEEDLAEWIIASAKLKKHERLQINQEYLHEKKDRERRMRRLGRTKRTKDFV